MEPVLSHFFVTDHSLWAIRRNYRWANGPRWVLVWQGLDKDDFDYCDYYNDPEVAVSAIVQQKTGVEDWDKLPSEEIPEEIADLQHWQHIPGNL